MVQDHILGCACTRYGSSKTPYQLDLEVKDRKPAITPKVGDKVKIKSWEWYEKWKSLDDRIYFSSTSCCFVKGMSDLCGKEMEVRNIVDFAGDKRWLLDSNDWWFVPEFFEEVYPKDIYIKSDSPLVWDPSGNPKTEDIIKRLAAYTIIKSTEPKPPTKLKMVGRTKAIKLKKL